MVSNFGSFVILVQKDPLLVARQLRAADLEQIRGRLAQEQKAVQEAKTVQVGIAASLLARQPFVMFVRSGDCGGCGCGRRSLCVAAVDGAAVVACVAPGLGQRCLQQVPIANDVVVVSS